MKNLTPPQLVEFVGDVEGFISGPSLIDDLSQLFIFTSSPVTGLTDINILDKTGENEFTFSNKIEIPKGYSTSRGQISSDGLKLTLGLLPTGSNKRDLYIAERDSEDDTFDTFYFIDNDQINTPDFSEMQPSISENNQFFVFTRNLTSFLTGNDLYIAYNFDPVSTIDVSSKDKFAVKVSPNPASEIINLNLENANCSSSELEINVYSAEGRLIENRILSKTNSQLSLSISDYNSGLYFYKLVCDQEILTGSFVIEN